MQAAAQQTWDLAQNHIRSTLGQETFNLWFAPLRARNQDQGSLVLEVADNFCEGWLKDNYSGVLREAIAQASGRQLEIRFEVGSAGTQSKPIAAEVRPAPPTGPAPAPEKTNPPSDGAFNPGNSFETFVVGSNNNFAHAAALAVAQAPGKAYNPLFLYGGVGLGKTHLMHAIGHRVRERNPSANVVYVSSEKFTNEFIIAIKNNQTVEFRNRYRHVDVLLIDDIQFLEGKEQTQEEFFHTFNSLHEAQKQLVISSDRPPKEIQTLENRLRSRFEWGLLTDIQPPDFETREAILRKKAETEKVPVPDEVLAFIAKVIPSNIRELEGSLIRVVAFASLTKSPIGVELAAEVLKNAVAQAPMHRVTIPGIKERVAKHYGISVKEMEAQRRDQRVTLPRQIAMYIAWQLTGASLPQIAREFGKKDHTTAMYARDKIADMMEADEAFRNKIRSLVAQIQSE